jgi:hypothetical protein
MSEEGKRYGENMFFPDQELSGQMFPHRVFLFLGMCRVQRFIPF